MRASKQQKVRFGDFEVERIVGEGDDSDVGVDYLQCSNRSFAINSPDVGKLGQRVRRECIIRTNSIS